MVDLDHLLGPDVARAAADAAEPPDFATVRRRGDRRRRARTTAAVTAMVVAVVVVMGALQRVTATQTLPASSPSTLPTLPAGDLADPVARPLDAGTYLVRRSAWSATDFTVTFPPGWTVQHGGIYAPAADSPTGIGFSATVVEGIYSDACLGETGPAKPVGPSGADLVDALLSQPGAAVSGPFATTLGGRPATRVDLRIPEGMDMTSCSYPGEGLQIWHSTTVDDYLVVLPHSTASVYVVDLGGSRRQVFRSHVADAAPPADRAGLQAVLTSIRLR